MPTGQGPPYLLLPNKGETGALVRPTTDRTIERQLNSPGITNSVVQEQIFSGACTNQTITSTATTTIITGIPSPINFVKLFPGTTVRVKFAISFLNNNATKGAALFFASISPNTSIQQFGRFDTETTNVPSSTVPFMIDFPASVYNGPSTGNANTTGIIPLYFYIRLTPGPNNFFIDGNEWYSIQVSEIAP